MSESANPETHRHQDEGTDLDDQSSVDVSQQDQAGTSGAVNPQDYDPAPERERRRGQIALRLIWLLIGIAGGTFVILVGSGLCKFVFIEEPTACGGFAISDAQTVLQLLLTPVVDLVGAVTGFYYGEKQT